MDKPVYKLCQTTDELTKRYFGDDAVSLYGSGRTSMISLLSDVQHMIDYHFPNDKGQARHYSNILNDIKSVLYNSKV
jgi:hypothetical protein